MSYSQSISIKHRGLVIIAIDQSGSMLEVFHAYSQILSKCDIAAMIASAILDDIIIRARQSDGEIINLLDIGIVGYSNLDVTPLLHPTSYTIPISLLKDNHPELNYISFYFKNASGHLEISSESYSDWVEPKAAGLSNVMDMLTSITRVVNDWVANPQNFDSFPPIVINISDGKFEKTYLEQYKRKMEELTRARTNDGNAILFNVVISSDKRFERLNFPNREQIPVNHPAATLALMSHELPEIFHQLINEDNNNAQPPYISLCTNDMATNICSVLNFDRTIPKRAPRPVPKFPTAEY